jgi:hypothetical protein
MVAYWEPDYENEQPVTDHIEALALLVPGGRKEAVLHCHPRRAPYVEVKSFCGPYESQDSSYFVRVSPGVVQQLKSERLTAGTKHWGYTDEHEQQITKRGELRFWTALRELDEKCKRLPENERNDESPLGQRRRSLESLARYGSRLVLKELGTKNG